MCARYTVFTEDELVEIREIIAEVSRKFGDGACKTGEIRPTDIAPVLTLDGGRLSARPVAWGFPKRTGSGVIFNARSETALQRPMFSRPLMTRRCVIPSTGFHEWAALDTQLSLLRVADRNAPKTKLLFRQPNERMLYMAGMIGTFMGRDAFVILTTAASASMAVFHERMPVILSAGEREDWLSSEAFMREVLAREGAEVWARA